MFCGGTGGIDAEDFLEDVSLQVVGAAGVVGAKNTVNATEKRPPDVSTSSGTPLHERSKISPVDSGVYQERTTGGGCEAVTEGLKFKV